MDYEKEYKEARERAKKLQENSNGMILKKWLWAIFPEFQESEDEKIRKEFTEFLKRASEGHLDISTPYKTFGKWFSWFEKQGEIDLEHYKDGENEKRKFVGYGFLKCKGDFLSFKEGETYWLEYVGKDNYNVRSDNLLGQTFHIKPVELYTVFRPTTWPEKQNDKPQGKTALEAIKEEKIDNQTCVKPADKVGPKFHEGDWIVCDEFTSLVYQIKKCVENLSNHKYGYDLTNGGYISSDVENDYHLWTIKDAKDGDILITKEKHPFIFEKYEEDSEYIYAYCGINNLANDNSFYINDEDDWLWTAACDDEIYPATKEQRDLLFQKMTDAGYTFDFDKKELNKSDQNPVFEMITPEESLGISSEKYNKIIDECIFGDDKSPWSKEDEQILNAAILHIKNETYNYYGGYSSEEIMRWLQSLKPQPKQEWSEEDIARLQRIIDFLWYNRKGDTDTIYQQEQDIDWLKLLKKRIEGI